MTQDYKNVRPTLVSLDIMKHIGTNCSGSWSRRMIPRPEIFKRTLTNFNHNAANIFSTFKQDQHSAGLLFDVAFITGGSD